MVAPAAVRRPGEHAPRRAPVSPTRSG